MKLELGELVVDGRHTVPDPAVVAEAQAVLDAFIDLAPLYAGKRVRVARKHHIKFYEAALVARELGQSPAQFTRLQLEAMAMYGRVYPTAIACNTLQTKHDHNMLGAVRARYYISQIEVFKDLASIYGQRETLEDPANYLSPLVRHVLATQLGLHDVAANWRRPALLEYESCDIARQVFKDIME